MYLIALSTHNILQRKGSSENVLTCRGTGDNGGVRLCWGRLLTALLTLTMSLRKGAQGPGAHACCSPFSRLTEATAYRAVMCWELC